MGVLVIDCLHLEILQCTCTCGHQWTHSYSLCASKNHGLLGGKPNPQMLHKLQHESYTQHYRHFTGCSRCVPLQLSEGWTKPLSAEAFKPGPVGPASKPTSATEDLLA